jgi:hypothetical protein
MQQLSSSQASPEVPINENFETLEHQQVYGKRHPATTGLTWAFYGGRWGGFAVSDGTVTLANNATNHLVVARSTGVLSSSTSTTNWDNTTDYARVYKITTASGVVTAVEDHRAGPNGVHGTAPLPVSVDDNVTALTISSGAVNIDCALGDYFTLALNANVTSITFSNLPGSGKGATKMIRITQDTTARTVAWPSSFKWADGTAGAVSTASGAIDVLAITTFNNGAAWHATLAKDFS